MTDWPVKTLGDVCDLVGGGTPSKDRLEFYGGDIPWATVRDLNVEVLRTTEHSITAEAVKSSSSNVIPAGSVVIATRVGLGKAVIIAQDTAINQDLRGLVVKKPKELISDYLYWWYLSIVHLVVAAGTGATVQGVKLPFVSGLAIPVPPLDEQKRIVALLDAATARITELTVCYEQARTHANDLFTSALRDALDSNPEWPTKRLDEISEVRDGTHESPKPSASGFPLVTSKNIRNNRVTLEGSYLISTVDYDQINRRSKVDKFDLLISMIGTVGEVCMVTSEPDFAIKNVGLIKTGNESLSRYLHYFLVSQVGKSEIRKSESGTTQRFIGLGKLRGLKIVVPPPLEQQQIVASLDSMKAKTLEMVGAYDAKLTAAKDLRQSILEAAFTGEL
jgi:type I restriction enzyme S subunit